MRQNVTLISLILSFSFSAMAQTEQYIYEPVFGDSVFVRTYGDTSRQAVLLIHGVGDEASQVWDQTIPALQNKYFVLVVDLPGFGKSGKANELYTPQRYTAFLRWLTDEYQTGPVYLVGHSLGAGISLAFAGTHPSAVKRLVLADLYGVLHRDLLIRHLTQQKESEHPALIRGPMHLLNGLIRSVMQIFSDQSIANNIEKILNDPVARKTALGGNAQKIAGLGLIAYDFGWALDRVTAPTCIVWGEQDHIAPLRTAKVLQHRIKQTELKIIPDAAHSPMIEQPDDFNQLLTEFFTEQNSGTKKISDQPFILKKQKRTVRNIWKFDQIYSGDYDSLFIVHSKRVLLKNVRANYVELRASGVTIENSQIDGEITGLYIAASTVEIENSIIKAKNKAIQARGADIRLTGVTLQADTAMAISRSKFDIAGSYLVGSRVAITQDAQNSARLPVPDRSEFIFSVSNLRSGDKFERLHGTLEIGPENPQ